MSRFQRIQEALKPSAVEKPNDAQVASAATDASTDKPKVKEIKMPEDEAATAAIVASAHADGVKAANDRMNKVFASNEYVGREAQAAKLLGKNMTAEDIIDVLADMPKVVPTAVDETAIKAAAEEAARNEMAATIAKTGNSNVDAGTASEPVADKRAAADAVWAKARPLANGVK